MQQRPISESLRPLFVAAGAFFGGLNLGHRIDNQQYNWWSLAAVLLILILAPLMLWKDISRIGKR